MVIEAQESDDVWDIFYDIVEDWHSGSVADAVWDSVQDLDDGLRFVLQLYSWRD